MKFEWNMTPMEDFEQQLIESVQEQFGEQLRTYRCPDHGTGVEKIKLEGKSLDEIKMTISACCDRATEDATKLLVS